MLGADSGALNVQAGERLWWKQMAFPQVGQSENPQGRLCLDLEQSHLHLALVYYDPLDKRSSAEYLVEWVEWVLVGSGPLHLQRSHLAFAGSSFLRVPQVLGSTLSFLRGRKCCVPGNR